MLFKTVIASEAKQSLNAGGLLSCNTIYAKLFSCLILLFLKSTIFGNIIPGDSLKNKYDINDPRNPNCPCHKYQKLADDEFKQFQKKENKEQGNVISKNNNVASKRYYFSFSLFKLSFNGKKSHKARRVHTKAHNQNRKSLGKLARCFHF